jgi:hypothetical protein
MIKIEIVSLTKGATTTEVPSDNIICSFVVNANQLELSELEFCQIRNRKQNEKGIETIQVMADVSFE